MSDRILVIDADTVLSPADKFSPGRIVIRNDRFEAAGIPTDVRVPDNAERMDASSLTVVPGFIDPHIHGSGGADVMEATFDSMNTISRALARHGTTSFLPTTVSAPSEVLSSTIDRMSQLFSETFDGALPLGIHMEGPFLNPEKRGTHRAKNIIVPDTLLLSDWITRSRGALKLLTMAPEMYGASEAAHFARDAGLVTAMGHSDATSLEAERAVGEGTRYAVHTFNAMRALHHREPGVVGVVLGDDRIFAEIIADGHHVDPVVIRIFAKLKGRERILLVTDAISATGMPDGRYKLGTDTVRVQDGKCLDDEGHLAGSTLTQDQALQNFIGFSGMRLDDAVFGLTLNPARALNLEGRGCIEPGAHADLAMLDSGLRVMKTIAGGRLVFERHS